MGISGFLGESWILGSSSKSSYVRARYFKATLPPDIKLSSAGLSRWPDSLANLVERAWRRCPSCCRIEWWMCYGPTLLAGVLAQLHSHFLATWWIGLFQGTSECEGVS